MNITMTDISEISRIIVALRAERDRIDMAIVSMEQIASGEPRKRGRPPGSRNKHGKVSEKPARPMGVRGDIS